MKIGYLVHDLNNAHVLRRLSALQAIGASVRLAGFERQQPGGNDGKHKEAGSLSIGTTVDGALSKRVLSVLKSLVDHRRLTEFFASADILIARNLECLVLALRVARGRPVVYESLDIHRLLTTPSLAGKALQQLEQALLQKTSLVMTSSPGFVRNYFDKIPTAQGKVLLIENKTKPLGGQIPVPRMRGAGPPWVIGWFGALRCRKSFNLLLDFIQRQAGAVQLVLAGKPFLEVLPDLEERALAADHVTYLGPYAYDQLPALYGKCHFAWSVDWYEEGANSNWLLPNRIYEASAYGVVPIALSSVETGVWLAERGAGVLIAEPASDLDRFFQSLDADQWHGLWEQVNRIDRSDLFELEADHKVLEMRLKALL